MCERSFRSNAMPIKRSAEGIPLAERASTMGVGKGSTSDTGG
jgi:hypothetical protein